MSHESLNLFYPLWLDLRRVVGSTSWPKVISIVQSNGIQSLSGVLPQMKAVGLTVSEMYYACTFCRMGGSLHLILLEELPLQFLETVEKLKEPEILRSKKPELLQYFSKMPVAP